MKTTTALIIKYTAASQVILVKEVKPSISEDEVLEIVTKLFGKSKLTEAIKAHTFCVVDISSGELINTFLGTSNTDKSILFRGFTEYSFLAIDDDVLYDNCDESVLKLIMKTVIGKEAYKLFKKEFKDAMGRKPSTQEILKGLIGIELKHKKANKTEDDATDTGALIEMLKATDLTEEEINLLESGQVPESVKAKLPKEAQEKLKTHSVKVASLDLNKLPNNVKVQVLQLLDGRDISELSNSERAELLALAKIL